MLKVFRDNLKNLAWVLWAVIAVFVLLVFVDFGSVMPTGQAPRTAAATVGDETVTYGELQRAAADLENRFRQLYGDSFSPELAQQLQLPRQALYQLIDRKILVAEARRLGLTVSDKELSKYILEVIPWLRDEQGRYVGDEEYAAALHRADYTVGEFERQIRDELLVEKLERILRQNLYVSDQEVEDAYREQVERAKIRYLELAHDRFADQVEVSADEIADYFAAHAGEYELPEQRRVAYLLVDQIQLRQEVKIPESELQRYYESNQEEFTQGEQVQARHILIRVDDLEVSPTGAEEARSRLAELRRRIEAGEDFAELAREHSADPGSAPIGGDLGFFPRGQMTPEFERAAFEAQPGELVGPIETPFGFHLIEVTDRREAHTPSFAEVRAQIEARKLNERLPEVGEERAKALATRVREADVSDIEELRALAAGEPSVIFEAPEPFSRQGAVPGLGRSPAFTEAVFALDEGGVSEPVRVPRGWAVAYLAQIEPPRQQKLDEVEGEVRQAVTERKQQQLALDRLAQVKGAIDGGESLDQAAAELGVEIQESPEFGPQGTVGGLGYNRELVDTAMAADEGEIGGPFETDRGAVLFEVTERKRFEPADFEAARESTRQRLENEKLSRLLASLLQERRRELGVTIDRSLRESFQLEEGELAS